MNNRYYLRLSQDNIKKNAKMYIPYIFTCILMTAMIYIIRSLSKNPDFASFQHGATFLPKLLQYGSYVTSAFAVVIILYSNSFILQRRNREFGLLNILGMEKRHIAKLLLLETLQIAIITFVLGIIVGIGLEMLITSLLSVMLGDDAAKLGSHISPTGMLDAICVMAVTFVIVFLYTLRTLHFSNPIELLSGAKKGEKEPKTKLFMTIIGVLFVISGYTLSFFVSEPKEDLMMLMLAVLLVILGTYCIFVAGIIAFLKILKKRRKFYYKTKHFTSVSGLIYRMKRNAVGLSSVAILSTMVLISVSSTSALMLGIDDQLIDCDALTSVDYDDGTVYNEICDEIKKSSGIKDVNAKLSVTLIFKGEFDDLDYIKEGEVKVSPYGTISPVADKLKRDQMRTIELVHIDRMSSQDVKGADDDILFKKEVEFHAGKGEVAVLSGSAEYSPSEVELLGRKYKVSMLEYSATPGKTTTLGLSSNEEILDLIKSYNEKSGLKCKQNYRVEINYNEGADKIAENEKIRSVIERIGDRMFDEPVDESKNERITTVMQGQFRSEDKSAMMLAYGSLFFLGVFLGTLFVLETILIVYYKQLTEGYEDADRFKIMQNVGMSEEEVRSSIRSQILLVFFLPLIVAVIHTIFAFPMVGRLLAYLGLESTKIYLRSCLFGFIGYTVLYTVIYVLTAKLYYSIIKKQN